MFKLPEVECTECTEAEGRKICHPKGACPTNIAKKDPNFTPSDKGCNSWCVTSGGVTNKLKQNVETDAVKKEATKKAIKQYSALSDTDKKEKKNSMFVVSAIRTEQEVQEQNEGKPYDLGLPKGMQRGCYYSVGTVKEASDSTAEADLSKVYE